ncbi:hypothetical protein [Rhodoflexus sp.]
MEGIDSIIGKYKIVGIIAAVIAVVVYFNRHQQSESEKGKAELEKQVAAIEVEKKKLELEKQRLAYESYKAEQAKKLLSQHGGDESEAVNDLRKRERRLKQKTTTENALQDIYTDHNNIPNLAGQWMDDNNSGAYYLIEQNSNQITLTEYYHLLGESFVYAYGSGYVDTDGNATVTYRTLFDTDGKVSFQIKGSVLHGTFQDQQIGTVVKILAKK